MDTDHYLDLDDPDGPRLVGHRIWLDQLLYEAIFNRRDVDGLIERFPSLSREKIYACLLYFEKNRPVCLTRLYSDITRRESNLTASRDKNAAKSVELLRRTGLIDEKVTT